MDILNTIMSLDWTGIINALLTIIGGFSVLATMTPNTSDDRVIQSILNWVNRGALLVGKARVN